MLAIKSLDTKNHTYYYGYVSKYEKTEAEKAERRYMIIQYLLLLLVDQLTSALSGGV